MAVHKRRKITIVAVNGHAAGFGMMMQLPYDYHFVCQRARLIFPFVLRGIALEGLLTYFLPKLIGLARDKAIFLSGGTFSPECPLLQGLYHELFLNEKTFSHTWHLLRSWQLTPVKLQLLILRVY
ncbi:hypothetical protein BDZ89DRAFT_330944 [Hymenopellis radicata]|nr:hypothetical protein BDZ89DRAFT_330944 [Hymenopellis radicata]